MCEHGNKKTVTLQTGHKVSVDSCIAGFVQALNDEGFETFGSCCGHGHLPSSILLTDGREIRIMLAEQGRALDVLINRTSRGQPVISEPTAFDYN